MDSRRTQAEIQADLDRLKPKNHRDGEHSSPSIHRELRPTFNNPGFGAAGTEEPASPWRRLGAHILDSLCIGVLTVACLLVFKSSPIMAYVVAIFGWVVYMTIAISTSGQTIGKKIMNIKIVMNDGEYPGIFRTFFREGFGKWLSSVLLCIGYIMMFFHSENKALHDLIFDTKVVKTD